MTRQTAADLPDTRPLSPVSTAPDAPTVPIPGTTAHRGATSDPAPGTHVDIDVDEEVKPKARLLDLSLTQLVGGSLAAATAAALGSRLGVVGTIAGAAVLSVVSAIAASVYTTSMARAKDAVVLVRSRRGGVAVIAAGLWRRPDRATTRRVLATTGAVFAVAAAFLAGLQLATGARVTGTDLGGRTAAGVVVDSPSGGADSRVGDGSATEQDDGASTAVTPTPSTTVPTTPSTGTPQPTDPSTQAPGQATDPGAEVTTPATGATPDPALPSTPATATTPATDPSATP